MLLVLDQASYKASLRYPWSRTHYGIAVQRDSDGDRIWRRVGYFAVKDEEKLTAAREQAEGSTEPIHLLNNTLL